MGEKTPKWIELINAPLSNASSGEPQEIKWAMAVCNSLAHDERNIWSPAAVDGSEPLSFNDLESILRESRMVTLNVMHWNPLFTVKVEDGNVMINVSPSLSETYKRFRIRFMQGKRPIRSYDSKNGVVVPSMVAGPDITYVCIPPLELWRYVVGIANRFVVEIVS